MEWNEIYKRVYVEINGIVVGSIYATYQKEATDLKMWYTLYIDYGNQRVELKYLNKEDFERKFDKVAGTIKKTENLIDKVEVLESEKMDMEKFKEDPVILENHNPDDYIKEKPKKVYENCISCGKKLDDYESKNMGLNCISCEIPFKKNIMELKEVLENLCGKDKKNQDYYFDSDFIDIEVPRDNCFYF